MKEAFLNPEFQLKLVTLLVKDGKFLRDCGTMVDPDDFEPKAQGESRAAWIIAGAALDYWEKYHDPIGRMLTTELKRLSSENRWGDRLKGDLNEYVRAIRKTKPTASDYARDVLVRWRKFQLRTQRH